MRPVTPPNAAQNQQPQTSQKSTKRHFNWSVWFLALLLGGSLAIWQSLKESESPSNLSTVESQPPRPIETVSLKPDLGVKHVKLLGQVEASKKATIRTQIDGLVKQILVNVGDRVTPGMAVAILDNTDQQLALSQAKARLAQERSKLARLQVGTRREVIAQLQAELNAAKAREKEAQDNLQRIQELVKAGALSQRDLVQARTGADATRSERLRIGAILAEAKAGPIQEEIAAQQGVVAAAQAALDKAKVNLERTTIRANSSGVVQSWEVSIGDYVEIGDPAIALVSSEQIDIFLEVPEQLITQIEPGMAVVLTAKALPNWKQKAKIVGIVPATDATSSGKLIRISLPNAPEDLLPGMSILGNVELAIAPFKQAGGAEEAGGQRARK